MTEMSASFYVSSYNGSDENDGRSEAAPFKSLARINGLSLAAGDRILLERNSVFENQFLHITDSGSNEAPIEISSYGKGDMPIINAGGTGLWYQSYGMPLDNPCHRYEAYVSSAVLLYDAEYIHISDLEITNSSPGLIGESYSSAYKLNKTGVSVIAKNKGVRRGIHIRGLNIHNVRGNVYDKHLNNGGIYMSALMPDDESATGVARYEDIVVADCMIKNCSRWGICVGYTYKHSAFQGAYLNAASFDENGHRDIHIYNNYVKDIGGDGITVMYAVGALVEHNLSDGAACEMNDVTYSEPKDRAGKVAAAIWPWKCKDALFCYNMARNTRLNQDGMAYDADSGDGTVYEHNYSCLNEGGCIMFCLEESVNNTFSSNISYDDLGGTISPSGNADALIADNIFYVRKETPFVRNKMGGGAYTLRNNQIEYLN